MLYLAWDAWHDAEGMDTANDKSPMQAFQQGLITNILNPKAYLFYAAMLPQFLSGDLPLPTEVAILTGIYVVVATLIHAAIAVLSGTLAEFLKSSPRAVIMRKALAVLIGLAALWFFYSIEVSL
jgi:threonine/homoserine/homoserine lactone efflux protein